MLSVQSTTEVTISYLEITFSTKKDQTATKRSRGKEMLELPFKSSRTAQTEFITE